MASEDRL